MKKIILVPDSFKGTMTSRQVCLIMEQVIRKYCPETEIISLPIADGGEGTVVAFLDVVEGEKRYVNVQGPFGEDIEAYYGVIDNGETAIIEMALCAGLNLVETRLNPEATTTYGVGQIIKQAITDGCKKLIIGIGGSCTNDGGCGAASALGVEFYNEKGNKFIPTGGTLKDIRRIILENSLTALVDVEITVMCDVDNPLYGENGAAYIYSPQKGADLKMVENLDVGLRNLEQVVLSDLRIDKSATPGSGAAGGLGYGLQVFCSAELKMGIEILLDTIGFDDMLKDTDLVFSGEGKLDRQSLSGKAVIGVARRCRKAKVPLIAVVGDIAEDIEEVYKQGVSAVYSTNRKAVAFEIAKTTAEADLSLTMDEIMRSSLLPKKATVICM